MLETSARELAQRQQQKEDDETLRDDIEGFRTARRNQTEAIAHRERKAQIEETTQRMIHVYDLVLQLFTGKLSREHSLKQELPDGRRIEISEFWSVEKHGAGIQNEKARISVHRGKKEIIDLTVGKPRTPKAVWNVTSRDMSDQYKDTVHWKHISGKNQDAVAEYVTDNIQELKEVEQILEDLTSTQSSVHAA